MIKKLYNKCVTWAGYRYAKQILAIEAFIESSFFPIPPDVMIIPMVIAKRNEFIKIALIATIFSVLGALFGYYIGYYLNEGLGQSTKPNSKQPIERTVIEMRYNIRVLEPQLMPYTSEYDVENIIVDEEKIPASTFL